MGLAIEVGTLADRLLHDEEGAKSFRADILILCSYLESCGFTAHQEPEVCPLFSMEMFGYSGLHYLRRIAAHLNLRQKLPNPGDENASQDAVLQEYFGLLTKPRGSFLNRLLGNHKTIREYDHLILHSDAEGFYVPQDFESVLFPSEHLKIPGGMVGSSQRLLAETTRLAQVLELPLDLEPESEEVWGAAESQGTGKMLWQRYGIESYTCFRLYHAAKHSIAHSAVIVFT